MGKAATRGVIATLSTIPRSNKRICKQIQQRGEIREKFNNLFLI